MDGNLKCLHNFFTYNPTSRGVDTFEVPFIQSHKGVLCNWFGGCESISEVLATLLDNGFFYGFPWTPAIGYTFRKKEIPKLVFVFTNEFDNELCRQDESAAWTHSLVAVPGFENDTVQFNPARVGFTGIFSEGWKENLSAFDPYCVSWLNPGGALTNDIPVGGTKSPFFKHWENYIKNIAGVGNTKYETGGVVETEFDRYYGQQPDGLINRMYALGLWKEEGWRLEIGDDIQTVEQDGAKPLFMSYTNTKKDKALCMHMSPLGQTAKLTSFKKVITYLSRVQTSWDLRRRSQTEVLPSTNLESELRKILTDEQVDKMVAGGDKGKILGVSGNKMSRRIDAKYTNTLGFYHLRNVVSKWDSPLAAYLFTSDGSFQNNTSGSEVPYLYSDFALFQYIQDLSIPDILQAKCPSPGPVFSGRENRDRFGLTDPGINWKWRALFLSNMMYWADTYAKDLKVDKKYPYITDHNAWQNIYDSLATILGCGDSKKRTTIVWAFRSTLTLSLLDTEVPVGAGRDEFKRRLVFGLPLVWNKHSDASAKKTFKNWWQDNYQAGMDM